MDKKLVFTVLMMLLAALFICYPARLVADDVTSTPSSEPAANIGGWYDKMWIVKGVYQLTPSGTNFAYQPVAVPAATPAGYTQSGASVPMDFVITTWSSSGHMHFAQSV